jgi:putative ABC transport system permease protein
MPDVRLTWALLRQFSLPEWRHHLPRHATAVLAVLLGVALAFSVHLINASALSAFGSAVRAVNGQADARVHAAHGTLDETLYGALATHPRVARASPVIELRVQAGHGSQAPIRLRLIGLDTLVAAPLAPELIPRVDTAAPGVDRLSLFAPYTVSLNAAARQALGVVPGEMITAQAGLQTVPLKVIGQLTVGGEPTGVMDIAGAQALFGLLGRLHRIDLQLAEGSSLNDLQAALADEGLLPAGVRLQSAEDDAQRLSNVSRAYRVNLTVLALVALFTGGFLVFSILSLSVAKRLQQFALLGVLGLGARERLALVLAESAVVGVVGSALGLALGTGLAALALRLLGGDLGGGYFTGVAPSLQWSWLAAALYGGLGVLAAMAGGWLPARQAQAMAPAQALKGLHADAASHGSTSGRWLGPGLLVVGTGLATLPPVAGVPLWAYLSVAAILMGGIACVPAAVQAVLGRWPAPRQATWLLALERARRLRHTATIAMAGVVASLSLAVALTVMVASFRDSVSSWLDVVLPADLYARLVGDDDAGPQAGLSPSALPVIAGVPGVTRVEGVRVTDLALDPRQPPVALISRPLDDALRALPLVSEVVPATTGQPGEVGIHVSEAMVALYGAAPGQVLALPLVPGQAPVPARVRSVWRDYARQQGAIVIDARDYQRLTGDRQLNDLALWLAPDARTDAVQAGVRQALATQGLDGRLVEFAEPRTIREITLKIFDRSFAVTYWLQAVAIGIGLFGTAASFSAQVLARRKEFGLLSHLGFARRQVLGIVAGEGLALTAVGAAWGVLLGLAVSVVLVHVVNPQSFHWTMTMMVPGWRLLALALAVVVAGTLTAWLSGRQATGRDVVMAVKEDW